MTIAYYKQRIAYLSTKSRFCLTSRKQLLQIRKEFETLKQILSETHYLISDEKIQKIIEMIKDGTITGGMIPKINTCLDSVNNGVRGVVIMDGRKQHSILNEIFSDAGAGTLIR